MGVIKGHLAADKMLTKTIKDCLIFFGSYAQWLVINSGRKWAIYAKIMATKLKWKVDEISSLSDSSTKSINEFKISVASVKKSADTAISKLGSLSKKWRPSEDAWVQGSCTPEEESVLTVKSEDEVTEGVTG